MSALPVTSMPVASSPFASISPESKLKISASSPVTEIAAGALLVSMRPKFNRRTKLLSNRNAGVFSTIVF